MNPKFVWQSKHLGLGVGVVLAGLGLFLAVPENVNTWRRIEKTSKVFGYEIKESTYIRLNEFLPQGFAEVEMIPGRVEYKALGTGLLFLGSAMSLVFSSILLREYERIEQTNYIVRQSEFELEDLQLNQNTEVARWAIELDAQADISTMLNPSVQYLQEPQEEETEEIKDTFSETSTGFLGWVREKKPNVSQFKVTDLCKLRFNKRLLKVDEIRKFVDDLVASEVAEWLDDSKSTFRLLNV
ncbi:hypothetical protein SD81_040290 [Tolypothrix campylonemoides VB511288]|nr:hypothetical protein SD81_040290 [Tolypothrix campylonemoides VB511288]